METIHLATPWRRGNGEQMTEGMYFWRLTDNHDIRGIVFVTKDPPITCRACKNSDWCGPLQIKAPEPMPELVQVEGFNGSSCKRDLDDVHSVLTERNGPNFARVLIQNKDERTARLAFNAALAVLGGAKS